MNKTISAIFSGKLHELPPEQIRVALFFMGFLEYFFYVANITLITSDVELLFKIPPVMMLTYVWDSSHDIYYTLGVDIWKDKLTRRYEKIGSCLGAGVSLWLFPHL
jgi:hypothetical protein